MEQRKTMELSKAETEFIQALRTLNSNSSNTAYILYEIEERNFNASYGRGLRDNQAPFQDNEAGEKLARAFLACLVDLIKE